MSFMGGGGSDFGSRFVQAASILTGFAGLFDVNWSVSLPLTLLAAGAAAILSANRSPFRWRVSRSTLRQVGGRALIVLGALVLGAAARTALTTQTSIEVPSLNFQPGNWIGSASEYEDLDFAVAADLEGMEVGSIASDVCFALRDEAGVVVQFCGAVAEIPSSLDGPDNLTTLFGPCDERFVIYSRPGFEGDERILTTGC